MRTPTSKEMAHDRWVWSYLVCVLCEDGDGMLLLLTQLEPSELWDVVDSLGCTARTASSPSGKRRPACSPTGWSEPRSTTHDGHQVDPRPRVTCRRAAPVDHALRRSSCPQTRSIPSQARLALVMAPPRAEGAPRRPFVVSLPRMARTLATVAGRCGRVLAPRTAPQWDATARSVRSACSMRTARSPGDHGTCRDPAALTRVGERAMFHRDGMWRAPEMTSEQKAAAFGDRAS